MRAGMMREMGWMMTEMGWQVDEEVNQDKTGEADGMNLEVDSKDEQFCLSVCPSVCPSRSGILLKWLNI